MMKQTILWVEDTFSAVQSIAGALHGAGFAVTFVRSRTEALDLLAAGNQYDFVFLDSMMPEEDKHPRHSGCDLFRELRKGNWGGWSQEVPVIFVTAYPQNVSEATAEDPKPPLILQKPLAKTEALSELEKAFPGVFVVAEGSSIIVNSPGASQEVHSHPHLGPGEIMRLRAFMGELAIDDRKEMQEAAKRIQTIVKCEINSEKQHQEIHSFRSWVSKRADEIKEGLRTSAAMVSLSQVALRLLGII
jgi:CheY-like chemotaxis protein